MQEKIRRLEGEVKSTSRKMRDAEAKYVNLAATPPKVHVRTVEVVSEEMKQRLEEALEQSKKQKDLLKQAETQHSLKVRG